MRAVLGSDGHAGECAVPLEPRTNETGLDCVTTGQDAVPEQKYLCRCKPVDCGKYHGAGYFIHSPFVGDGSYMQTSRNDRVRARLGSVDITDYHSVSAYSMDFGCAA